MRNIKVKDHFINSFHIKTWLIKHVIIHFFNNTTQSTYHLLSVRLDGGEVSSLRGSGINTTEKLCVYDSSPLIDQKLLSVCGYILSCPIS